VRQRRQLVLTLTPLLDLMLVVIFAQYMDLQRVSAASVRDARLRAEDAVRARTDVEETRRSAFDSLKRQNAELESLRESAAALKEENAQLREQLAEEGLKKKQIEEEKRQAQEQVVEIAKVFKEMLDVPAGVVEKTLAGAGPDEIRGMQKDISDLRGQNIAGIIRHLREAAEFRKRWDVWEVHINPAGSVRIIVGGKMLKDGVFVRGADDFFVQAQALLSGIDEPKSFVLILESYGDATLKSREAVAQGLEMVREKFRNYWGQEKQIYVAKLGFTAETP